jgi:hypothetical protein
MALLAMTQKGAEGVRKPARASWIFRSALNPILKADLSRLHQLWTPLMAAVVIDASIASAWCFPDEQTDYTKTVLQAVSLSSVDTVAL